MDSIRTAGTIDTCPICAGADVDVREPLWFSLELERASELREPQPQFRCRECRSEWD